MGIRGLLQALKPFVEPVHVSKYSGKREISETIRKALTRVNPLHHLCRPCGKMLRSSAFVDEVGVDAYSWLHKGAYGCNWQELREFHNGLKCEKIPPYVTYCMHRIKMLQYNKISPVVVFDGGFLPLKALTEENRRRLRAENIQKGEQKLAEGDVLSAQDYFQRALEVTPSMANELIKVLRKERVEYVVAPYEADAQLAHLSILSPEEGGVSTIITEDSDLLAYGCQVVLFKMDKFGNGEELCLDRILQPSPSSGNGMSFRNFTKDMFLAMCVLAGCDFLASIPGIGVKTAHSLLAKHRNIHRVLSKLKFLKHTEFPEDYVTNFWQAKALFKHARVYDKKSGSLKLLNPLPDELLQEFGGETEFLGPDLPQSRARAIAIGQLDPITMCSFDVLLNRTPTPFSISMNADMEFIQAQKMEFWKRPKMEPLQSLGTSVSVLEGSQVSQGSGLGSLHTVPLPIREMKMELGTSRTVMSRMPPKADQKFLANFKPIAFSESHERRAPLITAHSQARGPDLHESALHPNNNPFRSQNCGQMMVTPDILSSPHIKLDPEDDNSGLSAENPHSSLFSSVEDSQQQSPSGEEESTSELTSLDCSSSSPATELVACCTTMDQAQPKESLAGVERVGCSNWEASQSSSNSCISVLADISPNVVAVSPVYEYPVTKTPSSAPLLKTRDSPCGSGGHAGLAKTVSRVKKSKSASQVVRRNIGGKRSRDSLEGSEGSILRFFKPMASPKKLNVEF